MQKKIFAMSAIFYAIIAGSAQAGPIMDRITTGEPIRIGFSTEVPLAYPGDDGEPLGFVNTHVLGVLNRMGHENIEPVVMDWGALNPALSAGRVDIITAGMYVNGDRCENVAFSEPMMRATPVLVVPAGNPKDLQTFEDVADKGAVFVGISGSFEVETAREAGVQEADIMTVPGATEVLATLRAGRADASSSSYATAVRHAQSTDGALEVTDPDAMVEFGKWASIAFRKSDSDFVEAFNAAQTEYLGSEEMMAAVAEYGYDAGMLPGDVTLEWLCENR